MFNPKPFSWRQAAFAALVSSAMFVSSCSDDDEPTVDGDPTVKVTSSATSDVVWNTVTLTIEASDDKNIARIEVKVDGTVAGTQTTSPFAFKWDTQKVADGSHAIVVTATDDAGKVASWEGTLKVQNTLLEFTPDSDMLNEDEKGYVFLSTNEGKTIAIQEFKNSVPVKITAPDYDGKDFTVTEAIYHVIEGQGGAELQSFTDVPRGKWVLSQWSESEGAESPGQANLTFSGADGNYNYQLISNSERTNTIDNQSKSLWLKKDPSMLFILKQPESSASETYEYKFINQIKVGTNPVIDLSQLKTLTEESVSMPAGNFYDGQIVIMGLESASSHQGKIDIGSFPKDGSNIIIRYPGTDIKAYFSHSYFYSEEVNAENFHSGLYDNKVLAATIGLTFDGAKFSGTVSGTLDYFTVFLNANSTSWDITTAKNKSVVIPEIPVSLRDLIATPDFTNGYADVVVRDIEVVNDYADLIQQIRTSEFGFYQIDGNNEQNYKELNKTLWEGEGGSRTAASHDRKTGSKNINSARKTFRHSR